MLSCNAPPAATPPKPALTARCPPACPPTCLLCPTGAPPPPDPRQRQHGVQHGHGSALPWARRMVSGRRGGGGGGPAHRLVRPSLRLQPGPLIKALPRAPQRRNAARRRARNPPPQAQTCAVTAAQRSSPAAISPTRHPTHRACPTEGKALEAIVELPLGTDNVNACKGYTPFPRGADLETEVRARRGHSAGVWGPGTTSRGWVCRRDSRRPPRGTSSGLERVPAWLGLWLGPPSSLLLGCISELVIRLAGRRAGERA
jgi:hypothetical protein